MRRPEIIMIGKDDCQHCQLAKKIIQTFHAKNKSLIDVKFIPYDEYHRNEVYGSYGTNYPIFLYKSKSGMIHNFDFMNEDGTERLYELLLKRVIDFSKIL